MSAVSRTQIDRLGERLRDGSASENDLRLLDQFRLTFRPSYEKVVAGIPRAVVLDVTGRPAKSTPSIVEKLRRESARLTQVQDIAGCRIVVADIRVQDLLTSRLRDVFDRASVIDRRSLPSHGYRAVHIVARVDGLPIEIQVRTSLQHQWAELSEKFSDEFDAAIKYGGGPEWVRDQLTRISQVIASLEESEHELAVIASSTPSEEMRSRIVDIRNRIESQKDAVGEAIGAMITVLENNR